jgi:hypothetical protein
LFLFNFVFQKLIIIRKIEKQEKILIILWKYFASVLMNIYGYKPFHLQKDISAHLFQDQNVFAAILKSVELGLSVFVEQRLTFRVFSEINLEIFQPRFMSSEQRISG